MLTLCVCAFTHGDMDTIKTIREALDVSQAVMADMLGIHQSTLSRLESGEIPTNKRTLIAAQSLLAQPKQDAAA